MNTFGNFLRMMALVVVFGFAAATVVAQDGRPTPEPAMPATPQDEMADAVENEDALLFTRTSPTFPLDTVLYGILSPDKLRLKVAGDAQSMPGRWNNSCSGRNSP